MLNIIDKLAGWWLDWRLDREVSKRPELARLKSLACHNDEIQAVFRDSHIPEFASDAAALLEKSNAENYLEFEMMPRLDRGLRPIVVTVRWKNGISPSEKAQKTIEALQRLWDDIPGRDKYYLSNGIRELVESVLPATPPNKSLQGTLDSAALDGSGATE